jgi:hypothetical protein
MQKPLRGGRDPGSTFRQRMTCGTPRVLCRGVVIFNPLAPGRAYIDSAKFLAPCVGRFSISVTTDAATGRDKRKP